jgi:hypothetical protein
MGKDYEWNIQRKNEKRCIKKMHKLIHSLGNISQNYKDTIFNLWHRQKLKSSIISRCKDTLLFTIEELFFKGNM